jgi:hypothetical protein
LHHKSKLNNLIDALIIFNLLFTSTTAWYFISGFGMNNYWIIFIALSLIFTAVILYVYRQEISINTMLKDKFNVFILIYMLWTAFTYFVNSEGKSTFLYIFKMWFIIAIYTVVFSFYIQRRKEESKSFIYRAAAAIFTLGSIHSVIAVYQIVKNSNFMFGVRISDWPPYNPASFYGNVNGLGAYLFIAISAGFYLLFHSEGLKSVLVSCLLVLQLNALYLTIARTSIVISIVFLLFSGILYWSKARVNLKKVFNKRILSCVVLSQLLVFTTINHDDILMKLQLGNSKIAEKNSLEETRDIEDMLEAKNRTGFNNRLFIWGAVLKDYKQYMLLGDGLQYNIVNTINVAKVISKRSAGAQRISYHNTLFRYFASNGLIGLLLFLAVFFYVPLNLLYIMYKRRKIDLTHSMIIIFYCCIFLYMQMEEAYLGEIGFVQLILAMLLGYSNSLLKSEKAI